MRHQARGALTFMAAVAVYLGLLVGVASPAGQDRDTLAHTAVSIVAAALYSDVATR